MKFSLFNPPFYINLMSSSFACTGGYMAREFSKAFYKSSAWIKCRKAFLSVHPYCNRCEQAGRITPAEHVHHKIWLSPKNIHDPYITLNWDNLEALCHDCHTKEHLGKPQVEDGLYFDLYGNLKRR